MTNLLPQKPKQKKELTPKQEAFIDCLIENGGNVSQAMKMAGVTHSDFDLTMLYDSFTYTVLITLENLGFCDPGEGPDFIKSKEIAL